MVKLSVIVPFFNVQPFVPDALHSLRANARPDYEFLLMDDGSTDRTPQLLEEGVRTLPGARIIRREHTGVSALRNAGIDESRGRYVTFMDGDDWYAPGYLPQLVAAMDDLDVDFVRTDHLKCTGSLRNIMRAPHGRRNAVLDPRETVLPADRPALVDYAYCWAGAFHRRIVDKGIVHFPTDLRTAEDRPWTWQLHLGAESCAVVNLIGVHYRRGVTTSLTQISDERQLDFVRASERIFSMLAADKDGERFLPKAVRQFCALIVFHLDQIDRFEPAMARRLKASCAAALGRLPSDVLADVLDSMDLERSAKIRRLRWRFGGRSETPDQETGAQDDAGTPGAVVA
ncbi:glycosyltransferase family 2 protein [Actinacidiphila paucisporea]|uniref:Glycosyl transferase family 2 n=1 Tax=Actinacidiphila paucisporea TaxID=310782 RepID=A0A1M6U8P1_9ACTN|nr:glycosyltransferase family 2 protein [Actinacidiphila paucisporea]SHK65544.1 Glycosyl transferase family 2 [Actinacidiphila paucisporea]